MKDKWPLGCQVNCLLLISALLFWFGLFGMILEGVGSVFGIPFVMAGSLGLFTARILARLVSDVEQLGRPSETDQRSLEPKREPGGEENRV
jgi:hypothetical protein